MIKYAIFAIVAMLPGLIVQARINFYLTVQNMILQDKLKILDTKLIICWAPLPPGPGCCPAWTRASFEGEGQIIKASKNTIQRQNLNILRALYFLQFLKFKKIKWSQKYNFPTLNMISGPFYILFLTVKLKYSL